MNGADDDTVYRVLDNGKYATLKTRALTNAFRCGFMTDTGSIIAKGINERTIRRQIEVVVACAQKAGIDFRTSSPWARISPVLRIKSIGKIGVIWRPQLYLAGADGAWPRNRPISNQDMCRPNRSHQAELCPPQG